MSPREHRQPASRGTQPPIVREAERIVYREKWRVRQEEAAERLACTQAVASTRLFPESPVIHVVAVGGQVVGWVRRERGKWIVVRAGRSVAEADTFGASVRALANLAADVS